MTAPPQNPGNTADYAPATAQGTVGHICIRAAAVTALAVGGCRGAAAPAAAPISLTREEKTTIDAEFTLDKKYWFYPTRTSNVHNSMSSITH
jgi:hypothetical protein